MSALSSTLILYHRDCYEIVVRRGGVFVDVCKWPRRASRRGGAKIGKCQNRQVTSGASRRGHGVASSAAAWVLGCGVFVRLVRGELACGGEAGLVFRRGRGLWTGARASRSVLSSDASVLVSCVVAVVSDGARVGGGALCVLARCWRAGTMVDPPAQLPVPTGPKIV